MAYDFSDLTPAQTRVLQNGGWHVSDASTFIQPSKRTVIKLIERGPIKRRLCPTWRMAHFSQENFGKIHVEPVLQAAHAVAAPRDVKALKRLMAAMATGRGN